MHTHTCLENLPEGVASLARFEADQSLDYPTSRSLISLLNQSTKAVVTLHVPLTPMSASLQDFEPSIQDYARYYGLAQDHRVPGPLESLSSSEGLRHLASLESSPDRIEDPLEECGCSQGQTLVSNGPLQCTSCTTARTKISRTGLSRERMFIDAATASLLAWVTQPTNTSANFDDNNGLDAQRCRRLKHALPILHSDHECDLQEFLRPYEPDLQNEFLPLEILDEEADEGLTWPSKYLELPNEIWKKLTTEKLEITCEALQYVSGIVRHGAGDASKATFEMDEQLELPYKRVRQLCTHYTSD